MLASLKSNDYRETPYWWDDVEAFDIAGGTLPRSVDVAIVGSGYCGLNAALETARAGRTTLVLEAETAGWGCSTRNGGQISTSIKPGTAALAHRFGQEKALAIHREGIEALDWIEDLIARESIGCDFERPGRFHAAHSPSAFDRMVRDAEAARRDTGIPYGVVERGDQHAELGTDLYHGGIVYPRHAVLHPARYHRGLLERVIEAGAVLRENCRVTGILREKSGFRISSPLGTVQARDVIVATNGYTGSPFHWLKRRIVPIGSYIIATEELPDGLADRLFPTRRIVSDSRRVVYYYRLSPDRRRVVFGGRVSADETDPAVSGPRLHSDLCRIFPDLTGIRIARSWCGTVAYSFDELAHTGIHDGVHYAMAFCGSGVSMASYLGMRVGRRVAGLDRAQTAFDDLPFPTRPLYTGQPWFLPAIVAWYRWRDDVEVSRAAA